MVEGTVQRQVEVEVIGRGPVSPGDVTYARRRITTLLDLDRGPILHARVTLTMSADPACDRPAMAEGELDVNGRIVRAHIAAHDMLAACDLLQRRLRDRLEHLTERDLWRRHQGREAAPGRWRHGDRTTVRPRWFDRPADERELLRTKTFAVEEVSVEEAAFDLEALDHDFLLFVDAATGEDALIEWTDDGYEVTPLRSAPTLALDDALERIGVSGERWLFFVDEATGRGNVLYQRFDGHYGLVVPAAT